MKTRVRKICILLFLFIPFYSFSQEYLRIWDENSMPNSKGLNIKDSIANERIYQVKHPGLYVFDSPQSEKKKAGVIIIPGGGYARFAYDVSGFQLAKWFNTFGVTAFVLIHRLPQSPDVIESYKAPLQDAQRAIKYIRKNASLWNMDVDKIGVFGSSAGGHLATSLSVCLEDWSKIGDSLDTISFIPNFTMLVSPVVTMDEKYTHRGSLHNLLGEFPTNELLDFFSSEKNVNQKTPPAFMVHASNDKSVSVMNSQLYYNALIKKGITKSSMLVFPFGGHSIALRNDSKMTNQWSLLAEQWLYEIGILND